MKKSIQSLVEKMEKLQESNDGTLKGGFASVSSNSSSSLRTQANDFSCKNTGDCTKSSNSMDCSNSGTCLAL